MHVIGTLRGFAGGQYGSIAESASVAPAVIFRLSDIAQSSDEDVLNVLHVNGLPQNAPAEEKKEAIFRLRAAAQGLVAKLQGLQKSSYYTGTYALADKDVVSDEDLERVRANILNNSTAEERSQLFYVGMTTGEQEQFKSDVKTNTAIGTTPQQHEKAKEELTRLIYAQLTISRNDNNVVVGSLDRLLQDLPGGLDNASMHAEINAIMREQSYGEKKDPQMTDEQYNDQKAYALSSAVGALLAENINGRNIYSGTDQTANKDAITDARSGLSGGLADDLPVDVRQDPDGHLTHVFAYGYINDLVEHPIDLKDMTENYNKHNTFEFNGRPYIGKPFDGDLMEYLADPQFFHDAMEQGSEDYLAAREDSDAIARQTHSSIYLQQVSDDGASLVGDSVPLAGLRAEREQLYADVYAAIQDRFTSDETGLMARGGGARRGHYLAAFADEDDTRPIPTVISVNDRGVEKSFLVLLDIEALRDTQETVNLMEELRESQETVDLLKGLGVDS